MTEIFLGGVKLLSKFDPLGQGQSGCQPSRLRLQSLGPHRLGNVEALGKQTSCFSCDSQFHEVENNQLNQREFG